MSDNPTARVLAEAHDCLCERCAPGLFPVGPRTGEHHLAVRFGDGPLYRAYLDGRVLRRCVELFAGRAGVCDDGMAICTRFPAHYCGCGSRNLCAEIKYGVVSVESIAAVERLDQEAG